MKRSEEGGLAPNKFNQACQNKSSEVVRLSRSERRLRRVIGWLVFNEMGSWFLRGSLIQTFAGRIRTNKSPLMPNAMLAKNDQKDWLCVASAKTSFCGLGVTQMS